MGNVNVRPNVDLEVQVPDGQRVGDGVQLDLFKDLKPVIDPNKLNRPAEAAPQAPANRFAFMDKGDRTDPAAAALAFASQKDEAARAAGMPIKDEAPVGDRPEQVMAPKEPMPNFGRPAPVVEEEPTPVTVATPEIQDVPKLAPLPERSRGFEEVSDENPEVYVEPDKASKKSAVEDAPADDVSFDNTSLLSSRDIKPVRDAISDGAVKGALASLPSQAISSEVLGDPDLAMNQLGLPVAMALQQWRESPESGISKIVGQYMPDLNQGDALQNDTYAIHILNKVFKENKVMGLIYKTVNDETTKHMRHIVLHDGSGITINPMMAKQFNADFDGDKLKITFHSDVTTGAKSASDWLLGTEGDPRIDPDFFALLPMYGTFKAVKGELEAVFREFSPTDQQLSDLVAAYEKSWKGGKDSEAGFRELLQVVLAIAKNGAQTKPVSDAAGDIIQAIYNLNQKIIRVKMLIEGTEEEYGVEGNDASRWDGDEISIEGAEVEAEYAPNAKAAEAAANTPAGWWDGKNMPFRITSGWGKLVRYASSILGQENDISRRTFIHRLSAQMSGIRDFQAKAGDIADIVNKEIYESVHLPNGNWADWLNSFKDAYNIGALIVNTAGTRINADMTTSPSDHYYIVPADDNDGVRRAFRQVYGKFKMGKLFGKKCPKGWEDVTLDQYVYENSEDLVFQGDSGTDIDDVTNFIGRLADLRTQFAVKIETSVMEAVDAQFEGEDGEGGSIFGNLLTRFKSVDKDYLEKVVDSYNQDFNKLVEALYYFWPDMFTFLGLTNPKEFATTELGLKFIEAKTKDQFLGVLFEAITRYRFAPVEAARDRYNAAKADNNMSAMAEAHADFLAELSGIEAISTTWGVIARSYRNNERNDGKDILDLIMFAGRGGQEIKTLLHELVKVDPQGRQNQIEAEVIADLFAMPKGTSPTDRFRTDKGHKRITRDLQSSVSSADAYGKTNFDACVSEVNDAFTAHAQKGSLDSFLTIALNNTSALVSFSKDMVGDSVVAIMEKTYDETEKARQSMTAKYLYSAVSYLKNAGVWSHMAYGGDFSVGKISMERFCKSPRLIARVLIDPKFSITVYDEVGREKLLSMEEIFQTNKPTEEQRWKWLKENPRAAMALRMTGQSSGVGENGREYTTATMSLAETMTEVKNSQKNSNRVHKTALAILADSPRFYALVSMTVGMQSSRRYQARDEVIENIDQVIDYLRGFYADGRVPKRADVVADVDRLFTMKYGIKNFEKIKKAYEKGRKQTGEIEESKDYRSDPNFHLGQIREYMIEDILKYSKMLHKQKGVKYGVPPLPKESAPDVVDLFKVNDDATVRAYFNVAETINNVKTFLDTGLNGYETYNLGALIMLATVAEKPCDAPPVEGISANDFAQNWRDYATRNARLGDDNWMSVDPVNYEHIYQYALDTDQMVYIEDPRACESPNCPCRRHSTPDQSTNYGTPQTPAFVRMLTIVRTMAAEALNLKSKTKGIDETDSIVKNSIDNDLFMVEGPKMEKKVNDAYLNAMKEAGATPATAMAAAREVLANHMAAAFRSMTYKAAEEEGASVITADDFINIAQIMIRQMPSADGGAPQLRVLAIGQINNLVAKALERVRSESDQPSHDDYIKAAVRALEDYDSMSEPLMVETIMANIKVHKVSKDHYRIIDERMTSRSRNAALAAQILEETGIKIVGESELNEFEEKLSLGGYNANGVRYSQAVARWSKIAGRNTFIDKADEIEKVSGDPKRRYNYRVLGVFPEGDAKPVVMRSIGPRNAYIIHKDSSMVVDAVVFAYKLGVNVILEGGSTNNKTDLTDEQWAQVAEKTGIDRYQSVTRTGKAAKDGTVPDGLLIPMFDIRLNGKNATEREGGFNAGVFKLDPKNNLRYFFESVINEHGAGDGEFVKTEMTDSIAFNRPGKYSISVERAFANLKNIIDSSNNTLKYVAQKKSADQVVAIVGTPSFKNYDAFVAFMQDHKLYKTDRMIRKIITNGEAGVGNYAKRWAIANGIEHEAIEPSWRDSADSTDQYGNEKNTAAGKANAQLIMAEATHAIAFIDRTKHRKDGADTLAYAFQDSNTDKQIELVVTAGEGYGTVMSSMIDPNPKPLRRPEILETIKHRGVPEAKVVSADEIKKLIIRPYLNGNFKDIRFDFGQDMPDPDSDEAVILGDAIDRFVSRARRGELTPEGWLRTAKAGDIVGFMKVEVGKGAAKKTYFHPVRPFERGAHVGTPTDMTIKGLSFDESTGNIDVDWVSEGTMAGRFFKVFEDGNASVKLMARAKSIADIALEDGELVMGYINKMSTSTRRLLWKRQQKMLTLLYKARTSPWGYNVAEAGGLEAYPELKEMVASGTSQIGNWNKYIQRDSDGELIPIEFFPGEAKMNDMLTYMADRCVKYGVDPTVMFASHHGGRPNNLWFNFQLVLKADMESMDYFMKFMHKMNPKLVANGTTDRSNGYMFDNNLQVRRPVLNKDGSFAGYEKVDLFGGFHFFDEHYYGYSGSGTRVAAYSVSSLPALMAGGKKLTYAMLEQYLDFINVGGRLKGRLPSRMMSEDEPDEI